MDFEKTLEKFKSDIEVEIQALGINIESSLATVKLLLAGVLVLGIIAIFHFW